LQTIPPAQMVADLRTGSIDGYCVGDPWNLRAAKEQIGFTIASDVDLWAGHPGKVLGVREDWAMAYPNTHIALVKALLDACRYCADPANSEEIKQLLSRKAYVATDPAYLELGVDQHGASVHHLFFGDGVNRPSRTEHLWMMTQIARWGTIPFPRNWVEVLERVCRVSVFSTAARELGLLDIKYRTGPIQLFDGTTFNADDPINYLNSLAIKHEVYMAEIPLSLPLRQAA